MPIESDPVALPDGSIWHRSCLETLVGEKPVRKGEVNEWGKLSTVGNVNSWEQPEYIANPGASYPIGKAMNLDVSDQSGADLMSDPDLAKVRHCIYCGQEAHSHDSVHKGDTHAHVNCVLQQAHQLGLLSKPYKGEEKPQKQPQPMGELAKALVSDTVDTTRIAEVIAQRYGKRNEN